MRILCDIDNTLWDFSTALWQEELARLNGRLLSPSYWDEWNFYQGYVSKKVFYECVDRIHFNQDAPHFIPYKDSRSFLLALRAFGAEIVIASNREPKSILATERWLHRHGLVYDDIYLSSDKAAMLGSIDAVVDDSPLVLAEAEKMGIVHSGLVCPWNAGLGYPLFNSHAQIFAYLRRQCGLVYQEHLIPSAA